MPLPSLETTRYEVADGIATITLNRPDKLNAYNGAMREEIGALFDETDTDDSVRAVIVTGAGKAFCAGADLSSGGDTFDREAPQHQRYLEKLRGAEGVYRDGGGTNTLRIYQSLKPVIGAINGAAVGIGATIQLPMDVRMSSPDAFRKVVRSAIRAAPASVRLASRRRATLQRAGRAVCALAHTRSRVLEATLGTWCVTPWPLLP